MSCVLYVSRVAEADLEELENLFTTVGDVKNCRLETIPGAGHNTQFGVFEMATAQQTTDCVERFNGSHCSDGRYLSVAANRPTERCKNMNHTRSNAPVRYCPSCGEVVNRETRKGCDEAKHAYRRKERDTFCCDCGIKLRNV